MAISLTLARASARAPRGRLLLLAGGGVGLLAGVWTGLARAGVHQPIGPVTAHGIIMALGFLGTLIALERAVALGRPWAYAAPALSGLSTAWLLAGLPTGGAGVLLAAAGLLVVSAYAATLRRGYGPHLVLMAAGAVAWAAAAALWALGWSAPQVAPMLAAFLVLTIVGERLELSRLRQPSAASRRWLFAASGLLAAGAALTLARRDTGLVLGGLGLLAQAAWLGRNDVARATLRRPGLPRFAAACMLAGYAWLAASGALWIALGLGASGWLLYDAALHTLFLGFAMSAVMGHAPLILPAVLRVPLQYRPSAWLPAVLLHASVALRVAADLAGSGWLRGLATHGNTAAVLLFAALAAVSARHAPAAQAGEARP